MEVGVRGEGSRGCVGGDGLLRMVRVRWVQMANGAGHRNRKGTWLARRKEASDRWMDPQNHHFRITGVLSENMNPLPLSLSVVPGDFNSDLKQMTW